MEIAELERMMGRIAERLMHYNKIHWTYDH